MSMVWPTLRLRTWTAKEQFSLCCSIFCCGCFLFILCLFSFSSTKPRTGKNVYEMTHFVSGET